MKTSAAQASTPLKAKHALSSEIKKKLRMGYALRRIPPARLASLLPCATPPQSGDVALVRVETIGKNAGLELTDGRRCSLHEGDFLAVVFGNRYATQQFEGYARAEGDRCDMLSMAGLCGLVASKHPDIAEPTKLRLLGCLGDDQFRPLRLHDFSLPPLPSLREPHVIVVCGSSMDAGKTYTAMSLIAGLRRQEQRVAAIKLTGTAAGRDTWSMLDAGALPALDFVDGGYPSTYLCTSEQLLHLYGLLCCHAVAQGAEWVVVEIADGLLQKETAALLQSSRFTTKVDALIFATGDPVAAFGGVQLLRDWGIEVTAISGLISLSPLGIKEVEAVTQVPCLTARDLQQGKLSAQLIAKRRPALRHPHTAGLIQTDEDETENGPASVNVAGLLSASLEHSGE